MPGFRHSLDPIFRPRSVAVVGASATPGSIGSILIRNLLESPFGGVVYPVNRQLGCPLLLGAWCPRPMFVSPGRSVGPTVPRGRPRPPLFPEILNVRDAHFFELKNMF